MSTKRKPAYYRTPLRSRKQIADFLLQKKRRYFDRDYHLVFFHWDVKLFHLDLTFDNLLETGKKNGYVRGEATSSEWLSEARKRSDEHQEQLLEYGQEGAWRILEHSDAFQYLYDGTPVKAKYVSVGRSGGYIALLSFNSVTLTDPPTGLEEALYGGDSARDEDRALPYRELRKLYQLIVMLDHDFTREAACREVEHHAAFALFANFCSDIRTFDQINEEMIAARTCFHRSLQRRRRTLRLLKE
ncbi:MAG: hypothetical protein L0312_20200 [Acidobacteria bacterium]|nr:hypothetical protein [Acidobacteriota bacterium]